MSKFSKSLLVLFGLGLFASASTAQDVTSDILENAQDYSDRWVTYGKNYGAWRYMPDAQINRDTIAITHMSNAGVQRAYDRQP